MDLIHQPLVHRLNRRAKWLLWAEHAFNLIAGLLIGAGVALELRMWMGVNEQWSIGVGLAIGLMIGLGL